ncbi:hypothetical protein ACWEQL_34760 [Kitasatospora sp. NPDC004240]
MAIPAVLFLGFVGASLIVVVRGDKGFVEERCVRTGSACGVVLSFVTPFFSIAVATTAFLLYRYWRLRRPIIKKAKRRPQDLVLTAEGDVEHVLGRKDLCEVITLWLRDSNARRPCLLVGSTGAGKTAVLVQLTQVLAGQRRVPIPIRLRDVANADTGLDFRALAERRFYEEADPGALLSEEQCRKVWRQLCKDGRVVVLADGLESALTEGNQRRDRNHLIRRAIQRAEKQKLPLVIATRPHTLYAPLEAAGAAVVDLGPQAVVIDLEPLDAGTVSDEIAGRLDPQNARLDWLAEGAGIAESPLYLQLILQLRLNGLLEVLARGHSNLPPPEDGQSELRLQLLRAWEEALITGRLHEDMALSESERDTTIRTIAVLATIGLLRNRREVAFDQVDSPSTEAHLSPGPLQEALRKLHGVADIPLGLLALHASRAEQLGLVEASGDRIRFRQGPVQAYLGSRHLGSVPNWLEDSLANHAGRDLLDAVVLKSRADDPITSERIAESLRCSAERWRDARALDLYSAALEVDLYAQERSPECALSIHEHLADVVLERWQTITKGDPKTLEEAQLRLIRRFGMVLRAIARLRKEQRWPADAPPPAYRQLFEIAAREPRQALGLEVAQEVGSGGGEALDHLLTRFHHAEYQAEGPVERYHQALDALRAQWPSVRSAPRTPQEYRDEYQARVGELEGAWGQVRREYGTGARLAPMIVDSVGDYRLGEAVQYMELWLKPRDPEGSVGDAALLPLTFEVALARGLRTVANRRWHHPATNQEARWYLITQAETLLTRTRFWLSQMTLIHALCLWELPYRSGGQGPGYAPPHEHHHRFGPHKTVSRWLRMASAAATACDRLQDQRQGRALHPFVARAAELALLALETGQPEHFLWIDEKRVAKNLGSRSDGRVHPGRDLWIPLSAGWTVLDPRAQQLLADVVLLLNLSEQGSPSQVEAYLERTNTTTLPPCLTLDRRALYPERTVGEAMPWQPGATCLRDCPLGLCPYPAKGEQVTTEFGELFCRQQQALLDRHPAWVPDLGHRRAPWQDMPGRDLRSFWESMGTRARTPRV